MRVARRATVAFIFLIAPQLFPGQALNPSRSAQQTGPQQQAPPEQANVSQTSATQPARTPREDAQLHADILMARKEYAEAAALYQKLLQQEPRNALLLNKIGIAYHQQSMLDQAKRYYERATKADRTYASAYNNIGTIHYQRKNFGKAIRAYRKALEIHPDMAAVQSNLGYAYFGRRQYDEAMAAFRRALELDPAAFDHGRASAGVLLQDRSVEDKGMFYFFLAKSFASMGNGERCAHYLRKARDEGYKNLASVHTDPAFAGVLRDPNVQEILQPASTPDD